MKGTRHISSARRAARENKQDEARADETSRQAKPGARKWHVVHACEYARDVVDLVDAQIAAGMQTYVVTRQVGALTAPAGTAAHGQPGSLMQAWQDVRLWRKQLESYAAPISPLAQQVVHAHSFSSGMAAARSNAASVYDMETFVEDYAIAAGQCAERSWLARSFRAAEQFVFARTGAIVIHSSRLKAECEKRGVDPLNLFVIPDPIASVPVSLTADREWLNRNFGFTGGERQMVALFSSVANADAAFVEALLRGFALIRSEVETARLFVIAEGGKAAQVRKLAHALEAEEAVFVLGENDEASALASADIVVSSGDCKLALRGMLQRRAVLACDDSDHRDLSADGRGCLWHKPNDFRDIAHRGAFLARNADFRRALAEAGHRHIHEARDPERLGSMYDVVYAHAYARKRSGDSSQDFGGSLVPVQGSL